MLIVKIAIGSDTLDVEGDLALADARAVIDQWFQSVTHADQYRVDALARRLALINDRLKQHVTEATPAT